MAKEYKIWLVVEEYDTVTDKHKDIAQSQESVGSAKTNLDDVTTIMAEISVAYQDR